MREFAVTQVFGLGHVWSYDRGSGRNAHHILRHFSKIVPCGSSFSSTPTAANLPNAYLQCVLQRTDTRLRLFYAYGVVPKTSANLFTLAFCACRRVSQK